MPDLPPASTLPSPLVAGLMGRCPRCGKATMFAGPLSLASRCTGCGLDFSFADVGDGPSFFASFIGGFLVLGVGVWMQIAYDPALWVYPVVFIPFGLVVCLGLVRLTKGLLVAAQFVNNAGQGRLER